MTAERRKQVAEMLAGGATRRAVMDALKVDRAQFTQDVFLARREGLIPAFEPATVSVADKALYMMKNHRKRVGSVTLIFDTMTEDATRWLIQQVPDGSTLAETIAAIITDAYHEENP